MIVGGGRISYYLAEALSKKRRYKVKLITPDKENELIEDLKKRTGLDIIRVEVGAIDFSKDTAMLKVYYEPLSNEINSVDHVGRLPKMG